MSIETSNYAGLLAEIAALAAERDALLTLYETALRWIPVEERLPEPDVPVLAFVREAGPTSSGRWTRRIRAIYAPESTIEGSMDDEHEGSVYDEEKDAYFLREGWYEQNEYEEVHWMVAAPVTHWMPLPPAPKDGAT